MFYDLVLSKITVSPNFLLFSFPPPLISFPISRPFDFFPLNYIQACSIICLTHLPFSVLLVLQIWPGQIFPSPCFVIYILTLKAHILPARLQCPHATHAIMPHTYHIDVSGTCVPLTTPYAFATVPGAQENVQFKCNIVYQLST